MDLAGGSERLAGLAIDLECIDQAGHRRGVGLDASQRSFGLTERAILVLAQRETDKSDRQQNGPGCYQSQCGYSILESQPNKFIASPSARAASGVF